MFPALVGFQQVQVNLNKESASEPQSSASVGLSKCPKCVRAGILVNNCR